MKSRYFKKSGGFSLVELVVAVSIIIIITTVALYNQAQFSSDILITNAAYEVALTVRQAQVYGISSKGTDNGTSYRSGYGVHFEASADKPNSFAMFTDTPTTNPDVGQDALYNYYYSPSNGDTEVSTIGLTQGQHIRRFCANSNSGWECWQEGSQSKSLHIVFVKPNPDAHIVFGSSPDGTNWTYQGNCEAEGQSFNCTPQKTYDKAKIVVESGLGDKCRTVLIYSSGQISVEAIDPANPTGCAEPSIP